VELLQDGKKTKRKMRNLVYQDNDTLLGKTKAAHISRVKNANFLVLPISRQIPATSWRAEPQHVQQSLE